MRKPAPFRTERMFAALFAALDLESRLIALYEAHPNLTASGFDLGRPEQRPDNDQIRRALYWLCNDDTRVQHRDSSYSLKHVVEWWWFEEEPHENGYVSNGAMIAALLLAGWRLRQRGINAQVTRARAAVEGTTNRKTVVFPSYIDRVITA